MVDDDCSKGAKWARRCKLRKCIVCLSHPMGPDVVGNTVEGDVGPWNDVLESMTYSTSGQRQIYD